MMLFNTKHAAKCMVLWRINTRRLLNQIMYRHLPPTLIGLIDTQGKSVHTMIQAQRAQTDRQHVFHCSYVLYSVQDANNILFIFLGILGGIFRKIWGFSAIQPTYGVESGENWPMASKKNLGISQALQGVLFGFHCLHSDIRLCHEGLRTNRLLLVFGGPVRIGSVQADFPTCINLSSAHLRRRGWLQQSPEIWQDVPRHPQLSISTFTTDLRSMKCCQWVYLAICLFKNFNYCNRCNYQSKVAENHIFETLRKKMWNIFYSSQKALILI